MNASGILPFLVFFGQTTARSSPLDVLYSFNVPRFIEGNTEQYIGANVLMLDVDYWKDPNTNVEKLFVSTPRGKQGTPATLSTVTTDANNEPLLSPYPSWEDNLATCSSMVSVFRTQIDSCNRLWAIDSGIVNIFTDDAKSLCSPKIWIYDVITDTLINSFELPANVVAPGAHTVNLIVDIRNNECDNAFAYIADATSFRLIVFSLSETRFWYFMNRFLYPYPIDGIYNISGNTYELMDGVMALALGPISSGDRTLYLHSLASRRESTVQTSVLQNPQLAGELPTSVTQFKVSYGDRSSQTAVEVFWENALFFNLLGENTLACWPINSPYSRNNIRKLYKNETVIQFVSGMKIISGDLWFLSSSLVRYTENTLDETEINYRIIKVPINILTQGHGCRK